MKVYRSVYHFRTIDGHVHVGCRDSNTPEGAVTDARLLAQLEETGKAHYSVPADPSSALVWIFAHAIVSVQRINTVAMEVDYDVTE